MLSWRVTYMERTVRPGDGPPPAPAGVTFTRECDIGPDAYRDLHRRVGEDWLWWERIVFDDAALRGLGRALVALDHVYALNQDAVVLGNDLKNLAGFALVTTGGHDNPVAFFDF